MEAIIKGIVVGAAGSGSGKTTITLGLLAAAKSRGLSVAPFKVGPDFIDPGHHTHVIGRSSRNLDGWMLSRDQNLSIFSKAAREADLVVVEGVMGLYDGYDGASEAGSTAQMAKWLGLPVLLVVNASSMARSAAALVQGFERFDPELDFAGVLFNRIGSPKHLDYLIEALDAHVRMPVLGGIPRTEALDIPERHLGLHTAEDHPLSGTAIARLADLVEASLDMDVLLNALPNVVPIENPARVETSTEFDIRIGVARDRAFCFYYLDNLELLAACGAELVLFSPIEDRDLPENIDGLYLGGGYPELAAKTLSENHGMREQVRQASERGMPVYGECGGFMYLCRELIDVRGEIHPMTGCFPFTTRMHPKLKALGYREVTLQQDTLLGPAGQRIRGHEFHYSHVDVTDDSIQKVYETTPRKGVSIAAEGYSVRQTLGSYVHLHLGSCPDAAAAFAEQCWRFKKERMKGK